MFASNPILSQQTHYLHSQSSFSLPPSFPSFHPSFSSLSLSLSLTHTHARTRTPLHVVAFTCVGHCAVFILFIYLWLRWVFIAVCGLSLVVVSGGCTSLQCAYFSLQWLLLLRSMGSRRAGFSSCGTRLSSCVLFLAPPLTLSLKKAHQH